MNDTERVQLIRQLVSRALEMAPSRRSLFLEQACAGDDALRLGVDAALREHDAPTMVDGANGAAHGEEVQPAPERVRGVRARAERAAANAQGAQRFGPYQLLRVLGEGGMGIVYLAEQDRTGRLVALKLVRPGLASERLLRRFEQEVRTLGLLRHPGIARIYDAGMEDAGFGAQPYFAMEYVEGRALTEHAKVMALNLRDRLSLLASVCHAVHHAHTKGVIHRDIKPTNILVDATGQAKVLDFGVARAVEPDSAATMRTEAGQLVGTLPYMSPEQLGGDPADLDTRSDVYALGVVMYELLSGDLPHNLESSSLVDAVRIVAESDPRPLPAGEASAPTDVRTICFKALERDRERRYQSASDLAADIERYLTDQPISARAPSAMYLMRKFARRNRALVAGASAVLLALGVGMVGTVYMAVRATLQRDRAVTAESSAMEARRIAEEDAATAKAISGFLTSMLGSADPEIALGRELTVRDALELTRGAHGMKHPETFAPLNNLASLIQKRGRPSEAEPLFRELVEGASASLPATHFFLAIFKNNYGDCLRELGRFDEALGLLNESREALIAALGAGHARVTKATQRLVDLYEAKNDEESAQRWREALPALSGQ